MILWNSGYYSPRLCVEIGVLLFEVQPLVRNPSGRDLVHVEDFPNCHSNPETGHVHALCLTVEVPCRGGTWAEVVEEARRPQRYDDY